MGLGAQRRVEGARTMTDEQETNPAFARSLSNAGLGLRQRIDAHIRQLAPHMMRRKGVELLLEAEREILAWEKAAEQWDCSTPEELKDRIAGLPETY